MSANNWKTEEEARKQWCPHRAGEFDRHNDECQASNCAMWVWEGSYGELFKALKMFEVHGGSNVSVTHVNRALKELADFSDNPLGGCGLRRLP